MFAEVESEYAENHSSAAVNDEVAG